MLIRVTGQNPPRHVPPGTYPNDIYPLDTYSLDTYPLDTYPLGHIPLRTYTPHTLKYPIWLRHDVLITYTAFILQELQLSVIKVQ